MTVPPETPRCWSNGNKVIFGTKDEAARALASFKAAYGGKGKVIKCFPHDHYHLTKNAKGTRRTRRETRR